VLRVLVADPIAEAGLARLREHAEVVVELRQSPAALTGRIPEFDALIVRSETRVDAAVIQAGSRLKVIGRAGAGVDNIDVPAATRAGILVVNAPSGNTIAAAEHTMAMMLALARHLPQADQAVKAGRWERSRFLGNELKDKVLGVVGLGSIGREVAHRAQAFGMRVIAGPLAGVLRMRWRAFALFNFLGAAVWVTCIASAGYLFGQHWRTLARAMQRFNIAVLIVAVAVVLYLWWRYRRQRPSKND